ncbi:MAG TPA: Imm74 family immunity protein [Cytophagaceae bacterium]
MNKINYSIDTRGSMIIGFNGKTAKISGELIMNPPVFYADIKAFNYWEPPFENEKITETEKAAIIDFITNDSIDKIKTKVIFD